MTVETPEAFEVEKSEIRCDGGSDTTNLSGSGGADPLGHPAVFLKMGAKGWVVCPYCDRKFVLRVARATHRN